MRVLICGGRDFTDYLRFAREMRAVNEEHGPFTTVIHGGAKGADWCAHLWTFAPLNNRAEIVFKADWSLGKKAGPLRNQRMLDEGKPDLVVAFPGGKGTADMVRRARQAKVDVVEIPA